MILNAEQVTKALPWGALVDALSDIFTRTVHSPVRHHHHMHVPSDPEATLLLMPAWLEGEYLGVKQVNVFPGNSARGEPGLSSHYLLSCARTGRHLAQLEGNELTARRTAAASALAARYLARADADELLMVGAGRMGRRLIPAHRAIRPIQRVRIWDIREESAHALAEELRTEGIDAQAVPADGLAAAAGRADIISCATLSRDPLIRGEWLTPGTHLDLVGSFTPFMREADNEVMRRGAIFVDTREGALSETGDLIDPLDSGVIDESDILADFPDLCAGRHAGRQELTDPDRAITVFKSVGASVEDLAAAILAYERCTEEP
ncbi:ornithine cyclodeaminase family protein [Billgrantia antri]|uniref:Ornithine cyclodeaminase family protein n=1 Tax=Halomonas sulfidivorans TaxID=2733488 RepID=A0ABX7WD70_9GAMM|nr:ornithine cyclodeaminase family protein [Halomonas sulfidivorans]QTP57462.1 ornithine cyclodeaminase family protein [Halomonas sulfidivorans]